MRLENYILSLFIIIDIIKAKIILTEQIYIKDIFIIVLTTFDTLSDTYYFVNIIYALTVVRGSDQVI